MAEFQEVMKQWRRMCDKHLCADKQRGAIPYDRICPITISHNGYPCDRCFVDCSPESMAQVEQIVMEWASKHPDKELLPCPFCGGEALGPTDTWPHTITCEQCGASVKSYGYDKDGMKEAVKKWNRRADNGQAD